MNELELKVFLLVRFSTVTFERTPVLLIDVRGALYFPGFSLPSKHITINCASADVLNEGNHYDLPIVLAVLAGINVLLKEEIAPFVSLKELVMGGATTSAPNVLQPAAPPMPAGVV